MRNVEIKAHVRNKEGIISKAKLLSKEAGIVIKQHDTFFKTSTGRLKLRKLEDGSGELIHYERPDMVGPKLSDYVKVTVCKEVLKGMLVVLQKSNGIIGVVKKLRLLFIVGQTRVHIDNVDGLGDFMELENAISKFMLLYEFGSFYGGNWLRKSQGIKNWLRNFRKSQGNTKQFLV